MVMTGALVDERPVSVPLRSIGNGAIVYRGPSLLTGAPLAPFLKTKHVRFGAFGDPAAVPTRVWADLAGISAGWTGYTHHWRTCDALLRVFLMASVDSVEEQRIAERRGWRTFRVRHETQAPLRSEVICPASEEGQHSTTCDRCQLCSGLHRNAKNVVIIAHTGNASNGSERRHEPHHARPEAEPIEAGLLHAPPDFLAAVKRRSGLKEFAIDLAASPDNAVAPLFYTEAENALTQPWRTKAREIGWLNPPFADIAPWVEKAWRESQIGARLVMLVPAAVGANWWRDHVHGKAFALLLNGRLTFVGQKDCYPKDCALLVYGPDVAPGYDMWSWAPPAKKAA